MVKINRMFKNRNLKKNAHIKLEGLYKLQEKDYKIFKKKFLYEILYLKEKINFFLFNRLNIPQIEFTITTNCTLRCKNCCNYIPHIDKRENITTDFNTFKLWLDNLLGGES